MNPEYFKGVTETLVILEGVIWTFPFIKYDILHW